MSGAICEWCGGYLNGFDEHDQDDCYQRHNRDVYQRGAAKARAALAEARAQQKAEEA